MNRPPDLKKMEHDVHSAVRKMDAELKAFVDATHTAGTFESQHSQHSAAQVSAGLSSARQALGDARMELERSQHHLLSLERMLREYSRDWEKDLRTLTVDRIRGSGVAAQFERAREGARKNMQVIRSLLDMVAAALARARRATASAPNNIDATPHRAWSEGDGVDQGGVGIAAVTIETVRLLDVLRYGRTNCRLLLAYPTPQLSPRSNEGDGGLGKKILAGLGLCPSTETQDLRIEVPGFFRRLFRSGSDMPSGTHQGIGE